MGKETVAVFGGRGMLGTDVVALCAEQGFQVTAYDLPELDISDVERVREVIQSADAVINCAAYTNVDGAEAHADVAEQVNATAVGQIGALAAELGKWVLHFSTDFVFDGTLDGAYVETDAPNPINEYGRSKLAGERLLAESGCAYCLVRLEWTYGTHGRSFVTKLIDRAKTGQGLRVVEDQVGSPTATTEVARIACQLLEQRAQGLFHLASSGYVSRFGIARFIFDRLGLDVGLEPCHSSEYRMAAQRPLNSRFDCTKLGTLLSQPIEPWQKPLERFLRQL